jgi:hypothetical protein
MCGSDEPHPYPVRRFTFRNEEVRATEVQRVMVYDKYITLFICLGKTT